MRALVWMVLAGCAGTATNSVAPVSGHVLSIAQDAPVGPPDATIDLASSDGASLVHGQWRYVDATIDEIESPGPGPDLRASGAPVRTRDLSPRPGRDGFDEAAWQTIGPDRLQARRGGGHLSFGWYRIGLDLPERIGDRDVRGAVIAFEIVVDDYAEVWVNGSLAPRLGDRGGAVIAGFNAPNRVVLTEHAEPGTHYDVAVFAMNGPVSASPQNFLWVRSAALDLYREPPRVDRRAELARVERLDPRLDAIVTSDSNVERVATGFEFIEGPIWYEHSLLFSDPNANLIYRYDPLGRLSVLRSHSGYSGADIGLYHQPGSNGLAIDPEGRITICEHGNRRVTRLERTGALTVLIDRFEGRRLNSPNDQIWGPDGALYFTDPAFGLPRVYDDPNKELDFQGVFRVAPDGTASVITRELRGRNGIAFSPDGRSLYVGDWDDDRKIVMRFSRGENGEFGAGEVFLDLTREPGEEAIDGIEVDREGNLYVSGPGGVWIVGPDGARLGVLHVAEQPANFAWGGDDARTLYMTARTSLYRVHLGIAGVRPEVH